MFQTMLSLGGTLSLHFVSAQPNQANLVPKAQSGDPLNKKKRDVEVGWVISNGGTPWFWN